MKKQQGSRQNEAVGSEAVARDIAEKPRISSPVAILKAIWARIEHGALERNKILPAIDDRAAVGAYKMLRTRVAQRMRANNWHTLIVTSAGPEEGKTLTASNLAISLALDVTQSVFLIDLDLHRSSVAKYFGIEIDKGIGDYLLGNATIDEIVYSPENMDRLVVIPNRTPIETASEYLTSPRMNELLQWLQQQVSAQFVIFDMPPILASDDVLAFAPQADALLLVASQGITNRNAWAHALQILGERQILGVVLNRSTEQGSLTYAYD